MPLTLINKQAGGATPASPRGYGTRGIATVPGAGRTEPEVRAEQPDPVLADRLRRDAQRLPCSLPPALHLPSGPVPPAERHNGDLRAADLPDDHMLPGPVPPETPGQASRVTSTSPRRTP